MNGYTLEELLQQGAKPVQQRGLSVEQLQTQGANPIESSAALKYMTGQEKTATPEENTFLNRMKMSFVDPNKIKAIEQMAGTRGKFDWNDIADVIGGVPALAGGILGGITGGAAGGIGAVPGAAIGIGAGEAVRQSMGTVIKQWEEGKIEQQEVAKRLFVKPIISTTTALIGGKIFEKVGNYIASRVPKLFGILSGESPETIKNALKSPQQADQALKGGDMVLRNIIQKAGEMSIKLRDVFHKAHSAAKQALFSKVGKDKLVNRSNLWDDFYKILESKGVKITGNMDDPLNFTTSGTIANSGEISKIKAVYEALRQWNDFSLQGIDKFRQLVGVLTKFADDAGKVSKSPILGTYYHKIGGLLKNNLDDTSRKAYEEINSKFSSQIDLYDDMVDAFNSGDPFTRLAGALGDNKDSLRMLLNFYKEKTGQDILAVVSGRKLGAERQAAFGFLNPREWIDLVWSPSSQMRFILATSRAGEKISSIGEYAFPSGARTYLLSKGLQEMMPDYFNK